MQMAVVAAPGQPPSPGAIASLWCTQEHPIAPAPPPAPASRQRHRLAAQIRFYDSRVVHC